jgi:hypothetical protein
MERHCPTGIIRKQPAILAVRAVASAADASKVAGGAAGAFSFLCGLLAACKRSHGRQTLLDQRLHVGERRNSHDRWDDDRPRQRPRPVSTLVQRGCKDRRSAAQFGVDLAQHRIRPVAARQDRARSHSRMTRHLNVQKYLESYIRLFLSYIFFGSLVKGAPAPPPCPIPPPGHPTPAPKVRIGRREKIAVRQSKAPPA